MTLNSSAFTTFSSAHEKGNPLVLVNCWDALSAMVIANDPRCIALGTSSAGTAAQHARRDSEAVLPEEVIEDTRRVSSATHKPVSIDIEGGYLETMALGEFAVSLAEAGAVGINIEDFHNGKVLSTTEAAERIATIRHAIDDAGLSLFINARTDAYWRPDLFASSLDDALERAKAFEDAGAHGVFFPGVKSREDRRHLADQATLPVNFLLSPGDSVMRLADDGAARVSLGSLPVRIAMTVVQAVAASAFAGAEINNDSLPYAELQGLIPERGL